MLSRLSYTPLLRLAFPYIVWRLGRRHRWKNIPWREYLGFAPLTAADARPPIWIHTVSIGEAAAAAEMTRQLQCYGCTLLLTHTTPAGREWLQREHPDATVTCLPLDFPGAARRFLRRTRPCLGIFVEAEYWPNLLRTAKASGIKLMLANGRLGAKNARRYRPFAALMRDAVGCFDRIAAQTARDAGRLRCYGGRGIMTAGNLKFDIAEPPAETAENTTATAKRLSDKPTILLAATRAGEESELLAAMDDSYLHHYFTILAPRHPQRRDDIAALLRKRGIRHAIRSDGAPITADTQLYLADTMGEMAQWYAACDAALIGGSFLPYGGQNPIEAMRAGVATVIGPHVDNYKRLVRRATTAGALFQEANATAAFTRLRQLADNEQQQTTAATRTTAAAQAFCEKERGALKINLSLARCCLKAE